jgi:hypothetical protein
MVAVKLNVLIGGDNKKRRESSNGCVPMERRGRLILLILLTLVALNQIFAISSAIYTVFSDGFANVSLMRGVLLPGFYLWVVYYLWNGGDDSRHWVAWMLIAAGLASTCISTWTMVRFARLHPVGQEVARVFRVSYWSLGYAIFMGVVTTALGLLVRFSPSVIAYLDSRWIESFRDLDDHGDDEEAADDSEADDGPADDGQADDPAPREPIDAILAKTDDKELRNALSWRIHAFHGGNDADIRDIPEAARNVLLVDHVEGIIGNGGFRYLFESDYPGDPGYEKIKQAFDAIGCAKASAAFRKAFALFPDGRPPHDANRRMTIYLKSLKAFPTPEDDTFFSAAADLTAKLAQYIRSHKDDFRYLIDSTRRVVRRHKRRKPASAPQGPTAPPIGALPHWARVAFAARCARLVLPVLNEHWPNMPVKRRQEVERAIELVEISAATATPHPDLNHAEMNAIGVAGSAFSGQYLAAESDAPADLHAGGFAGGVARAASEAARTARLTGEESVEAAFSAWSFATHAAEHASDIVQRIADDFRRLARASKRSKWDDQTGIAADFFAGD